MWREALKSHPCVKVQLTFTLAKIHLKLLKSCQSVWFSCFTFTLCFSQQSWFHRDFTCYTEESFTGVHICSVTSGQAAVFVNRGQDRSWCQNQFISKRQTKCGICSWKQRNSHRLRATNIFTAAIFRHMFKHSSKTNSQTWRLKTEPRKLFTHLWVKIDFL